MKLKLDYQLFLLLRTLLINSKNSVSETFSSELTPGRTRLDFRTSRLLYAEHKLPKFTCHVKREAMGTFLQPILGCLIVARQDP